MTIKIYPAILIISGLTISTSLSLAGEKLDQEINDAIKNDVQQCKPIDQVFILPISGSKRSQAVALLNHSSIIPLDAISMKNLAPQSQFGAGNKITASTLVDTEISQLEKKKRLQRESKTGSWSLMEENRLADLLQLKDNAEITKLKPYLLKAVGTNEATGRFDISLCSDVALVTHLSLGQMQNSSFHIPLIVFLPRRPTSVQVNLGVAQ